MKHLQMLLPLIALFALAGCTPSPEDVCAHAEKLAAQDGAEPIANCRMRMQMKQDTKSAEYRKLAPCIMQAKSVDDINGCISTHQGE